MTTRLHADYDAARASLAAARAALEAARTRVSLAAAGLREATAALVALGLPRKCKGCTRPCLHSRCVGCARLHATAGVAEAATRPHLCRGCGRRVVGHDERTCPGVGAAIAPAPVERGPVHVWSLPGGREEVEPVDPRAPVLTTGGGWPVRVGQTVRGRVYRGVRGGASGEKRRAA